MKEFLCHGKKTFLILSLLFNFQVTPIFANEKYGSFIGSVSTRWLRAETAEDRRMELLEDFGYKDINGKIWGVPKGWIIDGASIPRFFWRIIGSPFVGNYREASVIHDYYCDVKTESWQSVHKMFHDAALAGGVSKVKASLMYAAVYAGGPRWKVTREVIVQAEGGEYEFSPPSPSSLSLTRQLSIDLETSEQQTSQKIVEEVVEIKTVYDDKSLEKIFQWIEAENPDLSKIEQKLDDIIVEKLN